MKIESETARGARTMRRSVMLRAPDSTRGYHLPRLAYAVQAFAKDPTNTGNVAALMQAIETYSGERERAEREAFLAARERMAEHLGIELPERRRPA